MLAVVDDLSVLNIATAIFSKQIELLGVCESVEANVVVTALDLTSVEGDGLLVKGSGLLLEGGILLVLVLRRLVWFTVAFPATITRCTLCHLMFS